MTGDGITWKSTWAHNVALGLAGEALSSHEVPAGGGAASKSTCHVKGTLKLRGQLICNVRVDPFVGGMVVTRIAAAAVEAQAGKEVRIPCGLPRAWSNDAIRKDASHGNSRAVVNKGVDGLMWGPLEVFGLGIVQLEEQDQGIMARKFSPKKYWRLLKDLGNVGERGDEVPEVVAPRSRRDATKGCW